MTKTEKAKNYFSQGLNCAQSVFAAFSDDYGMPSETAFRVACGLGGGARSGELCGAVSGAVLVIGLKYAPMDPSDQQAKQLCADKAKEFTSRFREKYGALACRELLGLDPTLPENRERYQRENLRETVCVNKAIIGACELLVELGY